jgi:hypothetical protein
MAKIFAIYTLPNTADEKRGDILGTCVLERDTRLKAIVAAEAHFEDRAFENGNYGPGSEDILIVSYDGETDEEVIEPAKLGWFTIRPTRRMNDNRFDYLAGIGAIRSI